MGQPEAYLPVDATTVFELKDLPTFLIDARQNQLLLNSPGTSETTQLINETPFLSLVKAQAKSFIAFAQPNDSTQTITYITRDHPDVFVTDSIPNAQVTSQISDDNNTTYKLILNNKAAFYAVKDSVFIASNSEPTLRQILKGNTLKNHSFSKITKVHDNDAVVTTKSSKLSLYGQPIENFADWTSSKLQIASNSLYGTGVTMAIDSTSLIEVFKGQVPQRNDLEHLIPTDALRAHSFTFSDATLLQEKLRQFRQDTVAEMHSSLFDSANEMGVIQLKEGTALVLKSMDAELTKDAWAPFISETDAFREVVIHNWSEPQLFTSSLAPLVPELAVTKAFQLDQYFVFTEQMETAERIITAFKNNNGLDNLTTYKNAKNHVSEASSLLLYELSEAPQLVQHIFSNRHIEYRSINTNNYPLSLLQYSYDRNFAHVHLVCEEANQMADNIQGVQQQFNYSLKNPIQLGPQFFSNHRTKGKDILVQDVANTLYLISDKGTITWSKELSYPILGSIEEVDILRNGKKQLVFSTKKALHVWDRNGRPVAPFPIKFKDELTQPVSVFDYDNNRKYRFLITQNDELFMYDAKGKIVKGFGFKKTKSSIVLPPQHLRIGNKDYIAIAEQNGTLNLLSRTGKERIGVTETFSFGETNIQKEGTQFMFVTSDNQVKRISSAGKVTSEATSASESYAYQTLGSTKVSLDDNLLRINKKLVELPFGIYTAPRLFLVNRKTYITTTETQENKVYVYDKSGSLLPGFPVYGTASANLTSGKQNKLHILVAGDDDAVLLYKMN